MSPRIADKTPGFEFNLCVVAAVFALEFERLSGHIWEVLAEPSGCPTEVLSAKKVDMNSTSLVLVVLWIPMFWHRQNRVGSSLSFPGFGFASSLPRGLDAGALRRTG